MVDVDAREQEQKDAKKRKVLIMLANNNIKLTEQLKTAIETLETIAVMSSTTAHGKLCMDTLSSISKLGPIPRKK